MKFSSTVLILDVPNRNGRTYPKAVVEKAVEEYSKLIAENRALGTFCTFFGRSNTVDLSMVSHQVTDLRVQDNRLIADIETLNTPEGIVAEKMLSDQYGKQFTLRPRGTGMVDASKTISEYKLHSIDLIPVEDAA